MSPFSVSGVMAMVAAGAGGETLEEVARGYRDAIPALRTNENFTLEAANSVFGQAGFAVLDSFRRTLHESFHAAFQETDFTDAKASARLINDWVEGVTREKIKNLIKPDMLTDLTRLVLVNAVYFKGSWATKFDTKRTSEQDFHLSDGTTKKVATMQRTGKFQHGLLGELEAAVLDLPYTGGRLALRLVLPTSGTLEQLEQKLRTADIHQRFDEVRVEEKVAVSLPKFKLEQ